MNNTRKIYMLAFISFFVSTSEYVIAGILDNIAQWVYFSGCGWAVNYCICDSERHRLPAIYNGISENGPTKVNDRFALDFRTRKYLDHHSPQVRIPDLFTNRFGRWGRCFCDCRQNNSGETRATRQASWSDLNRNPRI